MKNINIQAPINYLGYGTAGFNLTIELSKLFKVALWPIGPIDYPVPESQRATLQEAINNQSDFNSSAPSLKIWHQFDMASGIGRGPRIGFPIFELNKFNEREKHHLKSLDKIFVTSQWAKQVIAEEIGNNIPVHIVPLGVDRDVFFDTPPRKDGPYVFINIGKWEIRKGHDILGTAFNNAFKETDDVELWMVNHNPFLNEQQHKEWHDYYSNTKLGKKIKFLPRVPTQKDLANLMRQADCGVFPSRGEGWNLEALEMLSCGRQIIVTDYSAHTEFCSTFNANLIHIDNLEEAFDGIWFKGQGEWAELGPKQLDRLSGHMLGCYKTTKGLLNKQGIETAEKFSWYNAAKDIEKGLE